MKTIITNLEELEIPAEELKFISEDGMHKDEIENIISELKDAFNEDDKLYALSAKQIGINKRIFGIKFDNEIKFFINPIITKKVGMTVAPETFASMPGKEILIGRPDEITIIYYNSDFKYEDNKLIGPAARVFDQMSQLLDGVLPSELGLVSDVESDGSLENLSEEEIVEVTEIWKKFIQAKLKTAEAEINNDEKLKKYYDSLRFSESVINGRTTTMETAVFDNHKLNRQQRRAAEKLSRKTTRKSVK